MTRLTMMTPVTWVLGAPDPEMEAIERLLQDAGQTVVHATVDGRRVHPGNAYRMSPLREPLPWGGRIILVECDTDAPWPLAVDGAPMLYRLIRRDGLDYEDGSMQETEADYLRVYRVDHHRPGDPGYGRPPEEFLAASSIGQVLAYLAARGLAHECAGRTWNHGKRRMRPGVIGSVADAVPDYKVPYSIDAANKWHVLAMPPVGWISSVPAIVPQDIVLAAAADHCLAHAYAGRCPGVDPAELQRWRAEQRAAFQRRPVEAVLADEQAAEAALLAAPRIEIAGVSVADFGDTTVPELPETACRLGIPFLATVTERDGRRKQVLQAAPPIVIAAWPHDYGDPARGFAGRYI